MLINGKEREFLLTVGAFAEISKMCPDGNIERLAELISGSTAEVIPTFMKLACILNEQSEKSKKYRGEAYNEPLTLDELQIMDFGGFTALQSEIMSAWTIGKATEVETEHEKKTEMTDSH